jgi:ABC-type polysaccharide transport system, permease component
MSIKKAGVVVEVGRKRLLKVIIRDKFLLLLIIPVVIYFIIFQYIPMYGVVIAFKDFSPVKGILGSPWIGFKWFEDFFNSIYFGRIIRNTLLINFYNLIWGFPVPIIFALLLNELKNGFFRRTIQTVSYLPHFVTTVIIVGFLSNFLNPNDGIVNLMLKEFFGFSKNFMADPSWFRTLYVSSEIWQQFGWNSIMFIAALTTIDQGLYESAKIEGANRWQQMRYISIPGIVPTITVLLIFSIAALLSIGFEKVILMYNPLTYETADVISTYVYRKGIVEAHYEFGAAVGIFNSIISLILLVTANAASKKLTEASIW